jgi:hypothetical protein
MAALVDFICMQFRVLENDAYKNEKADGTCKRSIGWL